MKHLIASLLIMVTMLAGHAEDVVVGGVVYTYSISNGSYIATGWDGVTPIQSLHIAGEVDGQEVTEIAGNAFADTPDIVYLTIDEGIASIGQNAFARCPNLKVAILPEGLETIEEEAFAFCTGLTTMVIPSTVTEIQSHSFMGCTGVTDVYFLMTDETIIKDNSALGFHWWDGVYTQPGEDEHGGREFNTNQHTIVHVPAGTRDTYIESGKLEAWLSKIEEDGDSYPLWWIVNYGVEGRDYTVADDLESIYVDVNNHLLAKDDNHWLTPDVVADGEIDYMATTGLMRARDNVYDQSNWVELAGIGQEALARLNGHYIKGGTLKGRLTHKRNPVIEVKQDCEPQAGGNAPPYPPNVYIAASFMDRTQTSEDGERTFAFVRPKPQEYIRVCWLIYSQTEDAYFLPAPDQDNAINSQHIKGGVRASYELYEEPPVPDLGDGCIYEFDAISRLKPSTARGRTSMPKSSGARADISYMPYTDGGLSPRFIVCPLSLPSDPIPTAIAAITAGDSASALWFTIDGRCLGTNHPTSPGLYINCNKIIMIR